MPVFLPLALRQMLLAWPGATAVAAEIGGLTAIIVKCERADAQSAHRPGVTVAVRAEMGLYPSGPVCRLVVEVRDRPDHPLRFDTFLNPASLQDRVLLWHLSSTQDMFDLHFFDLTLHYQYTKRIPWRTVIRADLSDQLDLAAEHLDSIPPSERDFPKARDQMMEDAAL